MSAAAINHSCVPNVRVEYVNKGVDGGLMAEVKVVRPIGAGEELVQSYIDENLFKGMKVPLKKTEQRKRRQPFSTDDLRKILTPTNFFDCRSTLT